MKQTFKRFLGFILATALVFTFTTCSVFAADASTAQTGELNDYLIKNVTDILGQLNDLTDENIEAIKASDNGYFVSVATAWEGSKKETGKFVEVTDSNVEQKDGLYVVTCKTKFEKHTGDVVVTFDKEMAPETMSINVNYPMSYKMGQAAMNTVLGIGTVFLMLILLSFIISLFKHINKIGSKKEDEVVVKPVAQAPVAAVKAENLTDDLELVAVITAAIAASENTSTDSFVVRSIKRVNNNKWQRA